MDIDGWFQLTAARRRLGIINGNGQFDGMVSTHSRPKAAGQSCHPTLGNTQSVSTHSRPKAAGNPHLARMGITIVSTHSRPKAAGHIHQQRPPKQQMFQLTAARRRLAMYSSHWSYCLRFNSQPPEGGWSSAQRIPKCKRGFNSQPPEGGWGSFVKIGFLIFTFQLTAARRRLAAARVSGGIPYGFQLTAARRRLVIFFSVVICA